MKQISYLGAEGDCIVITQPTDIYALLDWCHSQMIEKQDLANAQINKDKWQRAINHLSELMDITEEAGFGNHQSIDEIEY